MNFWEFGQQKKMYGNRGDEEYIRKIKHFGKKVVVEPHRQINNNVVE